MSTSSLSSKNPSPVEVRSDNGSQITQMATTSILARLKNTGRFDDDQLAVIEIELERYFSDEDLSFHDVRIGKTLGDYTLTSLLGEGGGGRVYRAHLTQDTSESVAIKIIKGTRSTDRFRREMSLVLRLAHPNVVVAYDSGEHLEILYIVMEELTGPDLQRHVAKSGPMPWQQSIRYIADAASGLDHAHQRGLIHRDVSPGNLMLDSGRVKVTDLGLATLAEDASNSCDDEDFRTQHEILGGTPDYMAPEQAQALTAATAQSDIYSLGASWFYLLTGESHVTGKTMQAKVINLIRGVGLKRLHDEIAPPNVRRIIEKMLAYRPEDRYQNMAEVYLALQEVNSSESGKTHRSSISVLIVEDNRDDMFLTIEMLQRGNKSVTVCQARTLATAIEHLRKSPAIDLILLDLQLPDSIGLETVRQVRDTTSEVPIIVLTGQDDVNLGQQCIAAGADDFACKHDLTTQLLERIIFVTLSRSTRRPPIADGQAIE